MNTTNLYTQFKPIFYSVSLENRPVLQKGKNIVCKNFVPKYKQKQSVTGTPQIWCYTIKKASVAGFPKLYQVVRAVENSATLSWGWHYYSPPQIV